MDDLRRDLGIPNKIIIINKRLNWFADMVYKDNKWLYQQKTKKMTIKMVKWPKRGYKLPLLIVERLTKDKIKSSVNKYVWVIKIYFKEKNQADLYACGTQSGPSEQGRSNPRQCSTKKLPPSFRWELLFRPSEQIREPNWRQEKLASRWVLSPTSWMELPKK